MSIVWGFAPFVAFFVLMRLVSPLAGLVAALAVSVFAMARSRRRGDSIKILEIGSLALFGAATLFTLIARPDWSVGGVRLVVDGGLTLIAAISLAVGRPFTLQYAKEQVPEQYWSAPQFMRANLLISGAWTLSFALATACDAAATYVPAIPLWIEIVLSLGGLAAAAWFTGWYRARAERAIPATS